LAAPLRVVEADENPAPGRAGFGRCIQRSRNQEPGPRNPDRGAMPPQPPDIVLLSSDWQSRALIRAQLIEEGFTVLATDTWPVMRRHLRPGSKPRLAIIDLKGLANPDAVLSDVRVLMKPLHVIVLNAIGTVPAGSIERFGFRTLTRPVAIKRVVREAARAIQ